MRRLGLVDRIKISELLKLGKSPKQIAVKLNVSLNTVYNEIKRGQRKQGKKIFYDPEHAHMIYTENMKKTKSIPKLLKDDNLLKYIEEMILKHSYSPVAVLEDIKRKKLEFDVDIKSVNTIYSGIKKGLFKNLTTSHLHIRKKAKKQYVKKIGKLSIGTSIDKRPKEIDKRNTFGHWEMDCVIGKKSNKNTLLVLTERLTRFEIALKIPSKTTESVVKALDYLERSLGRSFYSIFKTISVDNGAEFRDYNAMMKAKYRKLDRVKIFYCHAYTSCERGSNENNNKLIRYFLKKGMDFDVRQFNKNSIKKVQDWINNYPRRMFDGHSAQSMFELQLDKLGLKNKYPILQLTHI